MVSIRCHKFDSATLEPEFVTISSTMMRAQPETNSAAPMASPLAMFLSGMISEASVTVVQDKARTHTRSCPNSSASLLKGSDPSNSSGSLSRWSSFGPGEECQCPSQPATRSPLPPLPRMGQPLPQLPRAARRLMPLKKPVRAISDETQIAANAAA